MKKIAITVNKEQSANLQRYLCKNGYTWLSRATAIQHTEAPYLIVDYDNKIITYGQHENAVLPCITYDDYNKKQLLCLL